MRNSQGWRRPTLATESTGRCTSAEFRIHPAKPPVSPTQKRRKQLPHPGWFGHPCVVWYHWCSVCPVRVPFRAVVVPPTSAAHQNRTLAAGRWPQQDTVLLLSCLEAQKLRFQGADHFAALRGPFPPGFPKLVLPVSAPPTPMSYRRIRWVESPGDRGQSLPRRQPDLESEEELGFHPAVARSTIECLWLLLYTSCFKAPAPP